MLCVGQDTHLTISVTTTIHPSHQKFALSRRAAAPSDAATSTPPLPPALSSMSPADIAAAQTEIRDRLSPSAVEFLRQRGAKGAGADGAGPAALAGPAAAGPAAPGRTAAAAAPPPPPPQGLWRDQHLPAPPPATLPPLSSSPTSSSPPVARIRWSLDGATPLALAPPPSAGAPPPATTSLQRDPLRVGDAAAPGYTLAEAAALARSALAPQRAAAAGLLGGVCATAAGWVATGVAGVTFALDGGEAVGVVEADGRPPAALSTPSTPSTPFTTTTIPSAAILTCALSEAAFPLRLLLDDPAPAVVAAAAAGLAALLLPSPPESPAWAPPCSASASTPRCWATRPQPVAAWTRRPTTPAPPPDNDEPGEAVPDAVAADPLAGLLQADLLPRAAWLLSAAPSPIPHALALVEAAARGGAPTATAALACPGLLEGVVAVVTRGVADGGGPASTTTLLPSALRCLGLLAGAAPDAARAAFARAGAPAAIAAATLAAAQADGAPATASAAAGCAAWAAAARAGMHVLHLGEAFPGLGRLVLADVAVSTPASVVLASTEALRLVIALIGTPAASLSTVAAVAADAAATAVDPSPAIAAGDAPRIAHAAAVAGLVAAVVGAGGVGLDHTALVLSEAALTACLAAGAAALASGRPADAPLSAACCHLVAAHLSLAAPGTMAGAVVEGLGGAALTAAAAVPPSLTAHTPATSAAAATRRPPAALLTAALALAGTHTPAIPLALFRLAAPGDEGLALHALTAALSPCCLTALLTAAAAEVSSSLTPALAAVATGRAGSWPCPPLPSLTAIASMSAPLTNGYAAAWLGLVPADQGGGPGAAASAAPKPAPPSIVASLLAPPSMADPASSRLPPPPAWPVLDFGDAAAHEAAPPRSAAGDDTAAAGAGAALRLWLGMIALSPAALPPTLLPATLDALFGDAEPWRDAWGRWAGATLLALALKDRDTLAAALSPIHARDAHRWAASFAADSFGDPLLAAAVALLLSNAAPATVQGEVLAALDEGDALHLLPSADAAPGGEWGIYGPAGRPADLMHRLRELKGLGRLERAGKTGSMVGGLVGV